MPSAGDAPEPLTVRHHLEVGDLVHAQWAHFRRRMSGPRGALLVAVSVVAVVSIVREPASPAGLASLALFGLLGAMPLLVHWSSRRAHRRLGERTFEVRFDREGLEVRVGDEPARLSWGEVVDVTTTSRAHFIYTGRHAFQLVPRRALGGPEEQRRADAWIQWVRELPSVREAQDRAKRRLRLVLTGVLVLAVAFVFYYLYVGGGAAAPPPGRP